MTKRVLKKRTAPVTEETATATEAAPPPPPPSPMTEAETRKLKAKAETDALLDEIDEVLEENAAAFVESYIQRGGQ